MKHFVRNFSGLLEKSSQLDGAAMGIQWGEGGDRGGDLKEKLNEEIKNFAVSSCLRVTKECL